MMDARPLIPDVLRDFRLSWPQLAAIDLLAKLAIPGAVGLLDDEEEPSDEDDA